MGPIRKSKLAPRGQFTPYGAIPCNAGREKAESFRFASRVQVPPFAFALSVSLRLAFA
jgi:hypothetical protein